MCVDAPTMALRRDLQDGVQCLHLRVVPDLHYVISHHLETCKDRGTHPSVVEMCDL